LRNNLRVESPSQLLLLIDPKAHLRVSLPTTRVTLPLHLSRPFYKGKRIASERPKGLEEKKCFKCYGYGHFQMDCPNRKTLSIREVEDIQALEEETREEEFEEEDHTILTLDVGKLLVIRRSLHAKEVPLEPSQREQIFHTRCTIGGKRFVSSLSIEVVAPMWLL